MAETPPSNAAVMAEVEALRRWVEAVATDTREARDTALRIEATLQVYDIPAKIEAVRGHVDTIEQGLRADIVNSIGKVRGEIADLAARVGALEVAKARDDGAKGLMAWLIKHAPWLVTVLGALGVGAALKDKLPH